MKIVFCIEASFERGLGHLFRSLRLAQGLRELHSEAQFLFVVNSGSGVESVLEESNFNFTKLDVKMEGWEKSFIEKFQPTIWINDRLDTTENHAKLVKSLGLKLVTFDDRGGGAAFSDIQFAPLVFGEALKGRKVFSGPDYLVIDPHLKTCQRTRTELKSVLIAMGGTDNHGLTQMILQNLQIQTFQIQVLLGPLNRQYGSILKSFPGVHCVQNAKEIGPLFHEADIMFSAGGMMPFEALYTGLPIVACASEEFERPVCKFIENSGAGFEAGFRSEVLRTDFTKLLNHATRNISLMSRKAQRVVDGRAVERIHRELLQ
jgi:spore coat polysaccharide biosynthesis predicted glycosyltransferase SpsG